MTQDTSESFHEMEVIFDETLIGKNPILILELSFSCLCASLQEIVPAPCTFVN